MRWNDLLGTLLIPGAQYADIYFERLEHTLVSMEDGRLEKVISGTEEGVGLRIMASDRVCYAHTNDLAPGRVQELARALAAEARGGGRPLQAEPISLTSPYRGPGPLDMDRRIRLVRLADAAARGQEKAVRQVQVTMSERSQEVVIVSPGRQVEGSRRDSVMLVQTVAAEGNRLERGYEAVGGSEGSSFLDEAAAERLARKSAGRALMMLRAEPAPAGAMPVVLSSEAGGTMVHEAIGHGLENDLAGQGFSVYSGKIGQEVASPLVSVVDDPTMPGRRGSYGFDDEGTPSRRNLLVDKGLLTVFISDLWNAARFGGRPTGNARRQSFRHPPIPRMSNTLILPGSEVPENIVRGTGEGLFVVKMGGGQVNTVNGDFVFEVSEGYLLKGGEVGPPVRGALLIGNGPAVLREIDAVGSDLGFGIGTCGKEGQGVPVADAQPTLRIPRLTVGGRLNSGRHD